MQEEWIPIVMLISVAAVFIVWFYLKFRSRLETQQTFRLALEKGSELSPEFIKQLAEPEPSKDRDLRRGLIWVALGVAMATFGLTLGEPDATQPLLASSAFPGSIGIAYLIMYFYGTKKES